MRSQNARLATIASLYHPEHSADEWEVKFEESDRRLAGELERRHNMSMADASAMVETIRRETWLQQLALFAS